MMQKHSLILCHHESWCSDVIEISWAYLLITICMSNTQVQKKARFSLGSICPTRTPVGLHIIMYKHEFFMSTTSQTFRQVFHFALEPRKTKKASHTQPDSSYQVPVPYFIHYYPNQQAKSNIKGKCAPHPTTTISRWN